jgi:hypothetical protein
VLSVVPFPLKEELEKQGSIFRNFISAKTFWVKFFAVEL